MREILAALVLSAGWAYSQTPPDQTVHLMNGRFWSSLTPDAQSIFLMGILDGWKLRGDTEESVRGKVVLAFTSSGSISYGAMARMVTAAYADPSNLNLPIGWVLMAEFAVQRGETTNEAVLEALRRHLENGEVDPPAASPIEAILNVVTTRN